MNVQPTRPGSSREFRKLWALFILVALTAPPMCLLAQEATYCNPLDLDYTYMVYNSHNNLSYRSGADPAVVRFRDRYYMFVTRSMGYWHSDDLTDWDFIKPRQWYFQGSNAPAAFNYRDSVLYMAGDPSGSMSVLYSDQPEAGIWDATPGILHNLQDPALFIDDDGQGYIYWGSSNKFPIRVRKIDRKKRFRPDENVRELFGLNPEAHGWERFGEDHRDTIPGYIEGPWMDKIGDTYYLQYAAPGTEFNVYGDGAYTAQNPLGPFTYMLNNPFSYKPGGFANGAGHGSTVRGPGDVFWHFASMAVNVNVGWERRIGAFPTFLDADGLMYSDTRFGDYPHFAPSVPGKEGAFTGWMLLSYNKPAEVSSQLEGHGAGNLTDENIKSYWVAGANDDLQWIRIDLEQPGEIRAIQINYNDFQSDMYGRIPGLYHQFMLEGSLDGETWFTLADRSGSRQDTPNAYVVLDKPVSSRYVRFRNVHAPTPNLSVSDLRVFGHGNGNAPRQPRGLSVERTDAGREAQVRWKAVRDAQGYNVRWGIAPDKLYSSWMVYGQAALDMKSLTTGQAYYFAVEAFNDSGVSPLSALEKID